MAGRECYHCRQWIQDYKSHDCWTTTEEKLTENLSEELVDAYQRLRETAVTFGDQRIYASHKSIMFSRKACYFFVRPQKSYLEVIFFLGKTKRDSLIRKATPTSKTKVAHVVRIVHRDEVEAPVTDWLREAYLYGEVKTAARKKKTSKAKSKPKKKSASKKKSKAKKKPR